MSATTLDQYQSASRLTAIYPMRGQNFLYPMIGIVSEVGEIADQVKRIIRDEEGIISEERRLAIEDEIGDVLWYLAQLATEFNLQLSTAADQNLKKLSERQQAGTLRRREQNP